MDREVNMLVIEVRVTRKGGRERERVFTYLLYATYMSPLSPEFG